MDLETKSSKRIQEQPVPALYSVCWSQRNKKQSTRSVPGKATHPPRLLLGPQAPGPPLPTPGPAGVTAPTSAPSLPPRAGPNPAGGAGPEGSRPHRSGGTARTGGGQSTRGPGGTSGAPRGRGGAEGERRGSGGRAERGGSAGPGRAPTWLSAAPSPLSWQRGPAAQARLSRRPRGACAGRPRHRHRPRARRGAAPARPWRSRCGPSACAAAPARRSSGWRPGACAGC